MLSLQIKDTKTFMSNLLVKDTFDSLLLVSAELAMAYTFTLNGSVNKSFFTDDEYNSLDNKHYSFWHNIKPFCYSFIKGSRVPSGMKIIFAMPADIVSDIIRVSDTSISTEQIEGLFINIRYKDNTALITTGASLKTFTLDRTIEHTFDDYICRMLDKSQIDYEPMLS